MYHYTRLIGPEIATKVEVALTRTPMSKNEDIQ